jgi:hypothetical protein
VAASNPLGASWRSVEIASMERMPTAMNTHSITRAVTKAIAPGSLTRLWIEYGNTAVPMLAMMRIISSTAPNAIKASASSPWPSTYSVPSSRIGLYKMNRAGIDVAKVMIQSTPVTRAIRW